MTVTVAGDGFGTATGNVLFGTATAAIKNWSNSSITVAVPTVAAGTYSVTVKNSSGTQSNGINFNVLTGKLIPVTFTVNNAQPTNTGNYIFVTGSVPELGSWGTTIQTAVGPMLDPNYPNWFLNVSFPRGRMFNISTLIFNRMAISSGSLATIAPTRSRRVVLHL